MNTRPTVHGLLVLGALGLFGTGCFDTPLPAADSGAPADVTTTDVGTDVPTDRGAVDTGRDVPVDVARDAGDTDATATDALAADAPETDAPAADAPAADAPETDAATDAPATDAPTTDGGDELAQRCTSTGGTIDTSLCCMSAGDFPNRCAIGACSCAPASSHTVRVCSCPSGMCFNPMTGCGRI
jgi:hypothetical protein